MTSAWTNERIAYLRDAEKVNDCYRVLAQKIAGKLPGGAHVCDVGCGIGELSFALAACGLRVTAIDESSLAVESLQKRAPSGLTAICGKVESLPLEEKYDAMIFSCFFSVEHSLNLARERCAGMAFFVARDHADKRILPGESGVGRCSAAHIEMVLRTRGIPFGSERLAFTFVQPFRSLFAAERYFAIFARGQEIFRSCEVRERLVPRDDAQFPYGLAQEKKLRLFFADLCLPVRE